MSPKSSNKSTKRRMPLFVGLLVAALSVSALGQSTQFPTYQLGENQNGSQGPNYGLTLPEPWVVSNGSIITPAGIQVYLSTTTRAKAIALNPTAHSHRRRSSDGRPAVRYRFQHPDRRCPADLQTTTRQQQRQLHRHHLYAERRVPAV